MEPEDNAQEWAHQLELENQELFSYGDNGNVSESTT
jgi:hypothetical protein